jgi:O-antigen ligase
MKPRTNVASRAVGGPLPAVPNAGARVPLVNRPARPAAPFQPLATNPVAGMALAVYVFLFSALAGELMYHAGLPFPLIGAFCILIFILYLLAGNPFRFMHTRFFLPWCALLFWWLLAGAAGFYKTRSITLVLEYGIRIHVLPLIFCGIAVDLPGLRKQLYGAGFALLALLVACFKWGDMVDNRLIIPRTTLRNPNDLALRLLLFGCLFLVFFGAGMMGRLLGVLTLPVLTYYVLKTGSRSNMVTLVVILAMSLFVLPKAKKALPILAIGGLLCAVPFLPKQTFDRLVTFFYVPAELQAEQELQNAIDSTNARLQLHKRAIELTLKHPLLGVGPANFEDGVEAMVQTEEGHRSEWQVAHNGYLQVSAESGLPGLVLFVWIIGLCLVTNYRSFRRSRGEAALIPFVILLGSVVYAVGILFCSVIYDYHLPLLVSLTAAGELALQQPEARSLAARPTIG